MKLLPKHSVKEYHSLMGLPSDRLNASKRRRVKQMAESKLEMDPSSPSQIPPIIDLLNSAGYVAAHHSDSFDSDKLFAALSWCISSSTSRKIDTVEDIEDALKMMGCPHAVQTSQIENLDYGGIYPALKWLVGLVKTARHESCYLNEKKVSVLNELQFLKETLNEAGIGDMVQRLASLLETSKALEKQANDFLSEYKEEHSRLVTEIIELEENFSNGIDDEHLYDCIDNLCRNLSRKLKFVKRELASKLRKSVSLKRQLDDMPIQEEVVQYEQRFSELDVHIQDRLHRTRNYYATYNALLEIKDLMLKEISLLNSLDSQFRDAIENPAGRMKLIHSVEAILKGTQQKREKVQPGLQVEHKALDRLREQYSTAITNHRRCSALLKAFQEERQKNKRLEEELAKIERLDSKCLKIEGQKGQTSS